MTRAEGLRQLSRSDLQDLELRLLASMSQARKDYRNAAQELRESREELRLIVQIRQERELRKVIEFPEIDISNVRHNRKKKRA